MLPMEASLAIAQEHFLFYVAAVLSFVRPWER